MEKEINVDLFGGKGLLGGREKPLEAEIIKCSVYNECALYKEGKCLSVYKYGSGTRCKHSTVTRKKGYTKRAKKYLEFKEKWEGHENYNKLGSVNDVMAVIKGEVFLNLTYLNLVKEDGEYIFKREAYGGRPLYIPLEEFTVELVERIAKYRPQAVMGGTIDEYEEESLHLFFHELKEKLPEIYEEYVKRKGKLEINYVGRKAYLKTLNPSEIEYRTRMYPNLNSDWYWDGEYLNYVEGYVSKFNVINDYEEVTIRIKPKDTTVVEVTSNEQVNENTKFE